MELERANVELVSLRRQNTVLSHRLSRSSTASSVDSDLQPKLALSSDDSDSVRRRGGASNNGSYDGSVLTSMEEDGFESVTVSPDIRGKYSM